MKSSAHLRPKTGKKLCKHPCFCYYRRNGGVYMVLIQHLFGIPSLRQTYREIQVNNAYRWFLGYGLLDNIPHFATVSYAFCQRFPDELTSDIFEQMLINSLRTYQMLEKYVKKQ